MIVTPQEILDTGSTETFKWVRMQDGSFRFCPGVSMHVTLVKKGEVAESAGHFGIICGEYIKILDTGSMTLKIPGNGADRVKLEEIFQLPVRDY